MAKRTSRVFTAVGVYAMTKLELVDHVNNMTDDADDYKPLTVDDVTDNEAQGFVNRFEAMAVNLFGVAGEEGALEAIMKQTRSWRKGLKSQT
jgi:hypothetical protein